ncbi:MAG TPA: alpha/beta fold hydrolase [Planctomycetota bacterium]|nr:alpha/beta fold hydrolase [Planctomycetota bacterium]
MNPDYRSPWWLPGRHVQTIYPYLVLRPEPPDYRRERVESADGDFLDFDWMEPAGAARNAPLLVLFHGLEGSSRSHYSIAILRAAAARGWRGVVPHWRGCGGEPNRLARAYHSGDHAELGAMLEAVRVRTGPAQLVAAGVSLGGNVLLNWLGREPDRSRAWLRAAASVSAPIDLVASGRALDRGLNRIYARNFLKTLVPRALEKLKQFPGLYDADRVRRVDTIHDFDDLVTAPLHGFSGVLDYWTRAASKPWLKHIALPTLVLNARNDPFIPGESLPAAADASGDVVLDQPARGGHMGFVSGGFPGGLDWLCGRLLDFLGARLTS